MFRYFIFLSYNGASYCGWQVQPNGISVQEVVTNALQIVLRSPEIKITGAGRTDAGVHATTMAAHFDSINKIESENYFCKKLNSFLPKDVSVKKIILVNNDAHARFSAIRRTYRYHIVTGKNVFKNGLAMRIETPLDFEKMNEAAIILMQSEDFTSFSKLHTDTKTNNCKITFAKWQQIDADEWIFEITADRFLRNMVRAIVGTLLKVGTGNISINDFKKIIEAKDRSFAGTSAQAEGLFLTKIEYPYDIFTNSSFLNQTDTSY